MGDKARIRRFCDELAALWEGKRPNMRFGQFVVTLNRALDKPRHDIFYLEEEEMLDVLRRFFSKEYQKERLENLIEEFRLSKVRKSLGIQLSGGERRRTEIARAVAINPKFILLDEPFAGVDPIAVEDIQSIVATLKDKNIGVIITDHNVHETLSITDRTYLLFEGRILKAGSAEDLANDEMVRKVYLGQDFKLR